MRYKEYNVNRVLETCIQLFWSGGFRGCSINDIVEATGVNRFSLYHEFDNKEGTLYHSLILYKERYIKPKLEILEKTGNSQEILKDFFLSFLEPSNKSQGCYIIHIGTELADSDPRINELVSEYMNEIEIAFQKMLNRNGETLEKAKFQAKHLVGLYCTSMSFCLILSEQQKEYHITNGINLIINKN